MSVYYRAVIVDLDRTLLRTDKTVSEYTQRVLRDVREAGAALFVATARPERAITEYLDLLDFTSVTTLNGARTITPGDIIENEISTESALELLRQLAKIEGSVISAETESGLYSNIDIPIWQPVVTDRIGELPKTQRIYKLLASHPDIPPENLTVVMPDDVYCTVADRKLIQFMGSTATKWNGILQMLSAAGIPAEQAIYFGDDMDDIEPIRRCGLGIAVANALEPVKAAADEIAPSNDEDGVAKYLEKLLRDGTMQDR